MTSRDVSGEGLHDQLDATIRWTLRDSVADVAPPAGGWERVQQRIRQKAGRTRAQRWRDFRMAFTALMTTMFRTILVPPPEFVRCEGYNLVQARETGYLCLLMYQDDLPTLLGQVV